MTRWMKPGDMVLLRRGQYGRCTITLEMVLVEGDILVIVIATPDGWDFDADGRAAVEDLDRIEVVGEIGCSKPLLVRAHAVEDDPMIVLNFGIDHM